MLAGWPSPDATPGCSISPVPWRNGLLLLLWLLEVNSSQIRLVLLLSEADAFLSRETEVGRELYFTLALEPASAMVQGRKLRHRGLRELLQVSHLHTGLLHPWPSTGVWMRPLPLSSPPTATSPRSVRP